MNPYGHAVSIQEYKVAALDPGAVGGCSFHNKVKVVAVPEGIVIL